MRISFHTSDIGRQQAYIIKLRTYYSQKFLGHINLDNTLLYIQIEQAIFGINSGDKYLVNATNNKQEIKKTALSRLRIYLPKNDTLYFRKRK